MSSIKNFTFASISLHSDVLSQLSSGPSSPGDYLPRNQQLLSSWMTRASKPVTRMKACQQPPTTGPHLKTLFTAKHRQIEQMKTGHPVRWVGGIPAKGLGWWGIVGKCQMQALGSQPVAERNRHIGIEVNVQFRPLQHCSSTSIKEISILPQFSSFQTQMQMLCDD